MAVGSQDKRSAARKVPLAHIAALPARMMIGPSLLLPTIVLLLVFRTVRPAAECSLNLDRSAALGTFSALHAIARERFAPRAVRGVWAMIIRAAGLAGALLVGAASAAFASDPPFLGNWARGDGKTHIRVERCGDEVCALNTWVRSGVSGEKIGDRLTLKIAPAGAAGWSGNAFDPQRNQTYTMVLHVADNRMTTDGCAMGGLMCRSMSWTRLN
jgi:uncharacterized protein (DUF2147 family)